ncbi:MAG: ClbS/DfsB family four-helix bundle protein [Pseudomonadota bacterium]
MAATDKASLQAITGKEYDKLYRLIDGIEEAVAMRVCADGVSIKDIVGHRAHWIDLFLGWYADGQAGLEVQFPAPGYKWNELKRYNADLRVRQAALTWDEAREALADGFARLWAFIDARNTAELYGGPMKGARNDWTVGRWAEAAGPSHFRSAAKVIRAQLRVFARSPP